MSYTTIFFFLFFFVKALKRTLEFERKDRAELERKALELIKGAKIKWEATERNKIEPLRLEVEQQKEKITQLETTNKMLNEQLQHAFKLENKHKESLEAVEQLSRRSMVGLESRLERVVADSKSRIKNLEATLDEAHCQKRNLENEVRRLKDNEKELMRQLEKTNKEYLRLNSAASDAEKLVKKLGQKVTELENEMENGEDLKVKMSRMKKEIECQKKRIEELERTNLLFREENKVVENYKAEIESLKEKRIEGEKRMSEVENKLQEVKIESEKKINELERKLQKEEQKSASLEKQMLDSENLVNESQELKEQRLKMYKMEKELGNVKIDKRILERELKDATNQIKELTKEKDEHKAKIDENRKIHEAALLELSNINENLSLEIMKITQSQKSFEDRLENERLKHEEEKRIIAQLKNALKEKDSIVSEFTSKANFFKDELLGVKEQCKKLEGEKYDGIVELGNSKKENGRLIDEVKDLKRQLETSQAVSLNLRVEFSGNTSTTVRMLKRCVKRA
jgi:chromosome segregation ATPase